MIELKKLHKSMLNIHQTSENLILGVVKDGTECELMRRISVLTTTTLTSSLVFVQGGLVNSIEQRVLEAQEYVEQAAESIPKCKKFKKTSRRVRCEMHTFYKLTHYFSFFSLFPFCFSLLSTSRSPIIPPLSLTSSSFVSAPPASTSGFLFLLLVYMSSTPPL